MERENEKRKRRKNRLVVIELPIYNYIQESMKFMFSNKDLMEILFPKWLRTLFIIFISVIIGGLIYNFTYSISHLCGLYLYY